MPITFVNAGGAVRGVGGITVGTPASPAVGDVWILCFETWGDDGQCDNPDSGEWTLLGTNLSGTGAVDKTCVTAYLHVYDGSAPSTTVGDQGNHVVGIIQAFRGVDPDNPVDATPTSGADSSNQTADHTAATGLDTVTDGAMVVLVVSHGDDTAGPINLEAANLASIDMGGEGAFSEGNDMYIGALYGIKTTAGAVGSIIWDLTVSEENAWVAIPLRPLADVPEGAANGSVSWSGAVTGTRVSSGSASGSISWVGVVDGEAPDITMEGEATGAIDWAGSVTGARVSQGAASGSIGWAGSVTGARVSFGAASGSIGWAGSVTGERVSSGAASGAIGWAGSVTGITTRRGAASGAIGWSGLVTGTTVRSGLVSGGISLVGLVTGENAKFGAATGAISWSGAAFGNAPSGPVELPILLATRDLVW